MRNQRRVVCGMVCALAMLSSRAMAQQPAAALTTQPSYFGVKLPFEQKWMVPYPELPTARVWRYRTDGELGVYTTAHSVGEDSALLFYHPKGTKPGEILIYDVSARDADKEKDISTYKGVCFWMKADGGDGNMSMGCEWNQQLAQYPRVGKFPLSGKEWKKFFVPWDKFEKPAKPTGFYFLNVKLEPATDRDCWAILSRVSLYKDENRTEEIHTPPAAADPAGVFPAGKFVEPSVEEAQKLLPRTMEKLKNKKPITIVVTGDSITAGAQLGNVAYETPKTYPAMYWAVLEGKLAKHYGYADKHRFVFKQWVFPDRMKEPEAVERFEIKTGQTPEADGTLPFDGLQIIGVGAGGKDSKFAFEHIADITQFKPDLVVWAYGANDATNNNWKGYKELGSGALAELKKAGIEVVLATPTPWGPPPYYNNSVGFEPHAREMAKAAGIPLVNQLASFTARGNRYVGDLLADMIHPNDIGHEQMSATLAAMLGAADQFVWDRPLHRARAAGQKVP